jgi:hypothetical protein
MGMPMIVGAHSYDEVQLALDWAAASVESYCERKFCYNEDDTIFVNPYRDGRGRGRALLPNPPVQNVSEVLGQFNVGGSLQWIELQHYQWTTDGLLYDTQPFYGYFGVTGNDFWSGGPDGQCENPTAWPFLPKSLQVTYAHGFAPPFTTTAAPEGVPPLPDGVIAAVIRGAAIYLSNPQQAVEGRVGEIANHYVDPTSGPAGWLDEKLLGQYRLVHL